MPISLPTTDHEIIRKWATAHRFVPAEKLPARVDGEPAELRFIPDDHPKESEDVRVIDWPDFFAKFDAHGLAFVYDGDSSNYNEILQIEELSPYRRPRPPVRDDSA